MTIPFQLHSRNTALVTFIRSCSYLSWVELFEVLWISAFFPWTSLAFRCVKLPLTWLCSVMWPNGLKWFLRGSLYSRGPLKLSLIIRCFCIVVWVSATLFSLLGFLLLYKWQKWEWQLSRACEIRISSDERIAFVPCIEYLGNSLYEPLTSHIWETFEAV